MNDELNCVMLARSEASHGVITQQCEMPPFTVVHVETGRHLYGGALQVFYLLRGLQLQRLLRNILVCPIGSAIAEACRGLVAEVIELPMRGDLDVRFIGRLCRVLHEQQAALVHLHSRRGADILGGIAARLAGVKCIVSRRVDNPERPWLVWLKYRMYHRVITISEGIRKILIDEGVTPEQVICVHSAVDLEKYQCRAERDWFLQQFSFPEQVRVLGMVAQMIPRKGHRYLLQALPELCSVFPELRVLMLGRGPLLPELQQMAHDLGLAKRVIFTGFRSDLERILPCLYGMVHPAEMEGLGVSLLQAAAAGLPIIATAVGGIPEIVRDGQNGILILPGDSDALKQAIYRLLTQPALATQFGQVGQSIVANEFSIAAMVKGNLDVYQELLKN